GHAIRVATIEECGPRLGEHGEVGPVIVGPARLEPAVGADGDVPPDRQGHHDCNAGDPQANLRGRTGPADAFVSPTIARRPTDDGRPIPPPGPLAHGPRLRCVRALDIRIIGPARPAAIRPADTAFEK